MENPGMIRWITMQTDGDRQAVPNEEIVARPVGAVDHPTEIGALQNAEAVL
ncbi:hypothetical protein FRC19_004035 [Serendipita sp. 401]|nr:hypothetical protein FRC19_004035 [Serendipita sp. 401]KAG9053796.1 hypothetical protein FS842_007121 [Serendipita sp. 407]